MAKVNLVLEGSRKGDWVCLYKDYLKIGGTKLDKDHISSYTIIDENNKD